MGTGSNALKVGIFTIAGALLVMAAIATVRGGGIASIFGATGYLVKVHFTGEAVGLSKGMPIRLKGSDVGYLAETQFSNENQDVVATLRIDEDIRIYERARVEIREEGLLGERYLSFVYPNELPEQPIWATEDHVFEGSSATGLASLIASANNVLETLDELLSDQSLRDSMTQIADGITDSLDRVNGIMENVDGIIMENQGYIKESMANVEAMSDNFLLLSQNLQEASVAVRDLSTDPKNKEQLSLIMANIESTTKNIDSMSNEINTLLSDPMVQADLKDSVRLMPEVLQETKNTMAGAQETLERLNEVLESADGMVNTATWAIEDVSGTVKGLGGIGEGIQTRGSVDVRGVDLNTDDRLNGDDVYVGDINFAVGNESNYVQVGIDNIGEGDDLNLMLGIGDLRGFSFRAGIHRSELGVGASWWDPAGIGLEATLYDLNDPKFNTYGHIPIGDSVDVVIGVDDLADEAVPTLGLGWKW
ncbi:MAG: MCE family protein [Planctomycetales bacterium]|nr:MCE family protein [bacterium]UNM09535.1 MAG: MCE family protein [Planctomycetales bacterium]